MSPQPPTWQPYEAGATLGAPGSQGGTLVRDEEFAGRARLTYEVDDSRSFHALTCSVPGWLVHHRFFDNPEAATTAFEVMKPDLESLSAQLTEGGPKSQPEARAAGPLLAAFLARFP